MTNKITKETLLKENILLKERNENLNEFQTKQLKELARAFNWKVSGRYDQFSEPRFSEPRIPTWGEVFVEIGKLIAIRDFRNFEGNISELMVQIEDMQNNIKQLKLNEK